LGEPSVGIHLETFGRVWMDFSRSVRKYPGTIFLFLGIALKNLGLCDLVFDLPDWK
jgi:hypothetical protein